MLAGHVQDKGDLNSLVVRLRPDGSLDPAFAGGGVSIWDNVSSWEWWQDVTLQPDGKIVLVGLGNDRLSAGRMNPNGSRDATFGSGGLDLRSYPGGVGGQGWGVLVQPDGKIVAVGEFATANDGGVAVVRYKAGSVPPAPTLDPASDTGVAPGDNITDDDTPTVLLPARPSDVDYQLFLDGQPVTAQYATADSYTPTVPLSLGRHVFDYVAIDLAGNQTAHSDPLQVFIGTGPSADAGGPYTVDEGKPLTLSAAGSTGDGPLTYEWDLDYDSGGIFHTDAIGVTATLPGIDGPATRNIALRVTDAHGTTVTDTTVVTIRNVAPTATFTSSVPGTVRSGGTAIFTNGIDASPADAANLTYLLTWNGQTIVPDPAHLWGTFLFPGPGVYAVTGRVTDKDGAFSEYTTNVTINADAKSVRTLRPVADIYVRDGSYANTNYGTATEMQVAKSSVAGNSREAYLRFDLSGGMAGGYPDTTLLRVFAKTTAAGSVPLEVVGVSSTTWSETGTKWSNKPAAGTRIATKTISSTTGAWLDFDVTSYLQQQRMMGRTAVAFVIRSTDSSKPYVKINSDEAASNRPVLLANEIATLQPVVSAYNVAVREGGTASFTVRLSQQPDHPVTLMISPWDLPGQSDSDLTIVNGKLTFTAQNWNLPQVVTARAALDADMTSGIRAFLITGTPAPASITLSETDTTIPPRTLRATADSYVRDGTYAGQNFGGATTMAVRRSSTAGSTRWTVLKFDMTGVSTISSAVLRLNGKLDGSSSTPVRVQAFAASSTSWAETGVNWSNKPAATGSSLGEVAVAGTTAAWYTMDLTAWLKAQKAAGKTAVSLILTSPVATSAAAVFSSDESSTNRPELVVKA